MSLSDERWTPPEVFGPLDRLFRFTVDPCGTKSRLLRPDLRTFTLEDDGRNLVWEAGERHPAAFVNPPYSDILNWARESAFRAKGGCFVAFLIPNDCSTKAWRFLEHEAWGRWNIPFRVHFLGPDGKKRDTARSHVVFFLGGLEKG